MQETKLATKTLHSISEFITLHYANKVLTDDEAIKSIKDKLKLYDIEQNIECLTKLGLIERQQQLIHNCENAELEMLKLKDKNEYLYNEWRLKQYWWWKEKELIETKLRQDNI